MKKILIFGLFCIFVSACAPRPPARPPKPKAPPAPAPAPDPVSSNHYLKLKI